jgi:hypothetical protein
MAASTVQLPNECACGTATWGQEGFLVERMVDEGCSEFGWRVESVWAPTRCWAVSQRDRTLRRAKQETGVSLCTLKLCTYTAEF